MEKQKHRKVTCSKRSSSNYIVKSVTKLRSLGSRTLSGVLWFPSPFFISSNNPKLFPIPWTTRLHIFMLCTCCSFSRNVVFHRTPPPNELSMSSIRQKYLECAMLFPRAVAFLCFLFSLSVWCFQIVLSLSLVQLILVFSVSEWKQWS